MRLARVAAVLGVASAVLAVASAARPGPGSVGASPICAGASTAGTLTGSHAVGPVCVLTTLSTVCVTQVVGLEPSAKVTALVCVPGG
jgi:hypothetical protein